MFTSNLIFAACVACKNPVQNRQKITFKNQVCTDRVSACLRVFCYTLRQMGSQDWRKVNATLEVNRSQNKINDLGIGNYSAFAIPSLVPIIICGHLLAPPPFQFLFLNSSTKALINSLHQTLLLQQFIKRSFHKNSYCTTWGLLYSKLKRVT